MRAAHSRQPRTASDDQTHVELIHLEARIEHWLRFGRPARETIVDRRRRTLSFEPGAVFAFVRWRANDFGTTVSRIDILRAPSREDAIISVPGVAPGGVALLRLAGWPSVARALAAIDDVDALGIDPADACPDHWRQLHNQLSAGAEPRRYSAARHRAWLARRALSAC